MYDAVYMYKQMEAHLQALRKQRVSALTNLSLTMAEKVNEEDLRRLQATETESNSRLARKTELIEQVSKKNNLLKDKVKAISIHPCAKVGS